MIMEPEKSIGGGLFVPGKERVVYVAPERKSRLGTALLCSSIFYTYWLFISAMILCCGFLMLMLFIVCFDV